MEETLVKENLHKLCNGVSLEDDESLMWGNYNACSYVFHNPKSKLEFCQHFMVVMKLDFSILYLEIKVEWHESEREITLVGQNSALWNDLRISNSRTCFDEDMRVESVGIELGYGR